MALYKPLYLNSYSVLKNQTHRRLGMLCGEPFC